MLSNAHCHPQLLMDTTVSSILTSWEGAPVLAAGTQFDDISRLLNIHAQHPHVLPTIGWHPWYIPATITGDEIDSTMAQFHSSLMRYDVPIGEVGLDWHPKWKATRKQQLEIFERFLILAEELHRPVVAHCVRAHHEILRLLKQYPKTKLYLHHYQGNQTVSAQYFRYNTYFGLPILHWSNRTNELIYSMPSDRLLVETDDCVASKEVSAQIQKHSIPDWLLLRCRNNLFQFIQGTSGDFSQQFEFCM